jgi:FkbM family methyltransferase
MPEQNQLGTYASTLAVLFQKGLRYSTVIDVGCADGHFFLSHHANGLFSGASVANIDANPLYEESLKAIREVMGGHYFIGAVSDCDGEVELTQSVHPYWSSLRPSGDPYWQRINNLSQSSTRVQAVTLDLLAARLQLKPPFLIKLDVQGAEVPVLRGARDVLRETDVVICEADIDDFQDINAGLVEAGFNLFDVTQPAWLSDRSLGWFYPVYLNRRQDRIRPRAFWDTAVNEQVIKAQTDRRKSILEFNAAALAQQRALQGKG